MTRAGRPCPRCRGAMFAERDRQHGGTDFVCISCGHVDYEIRQGEEQLAFDRERGQTYDKRRPAMYRKIRL